MAMLAVFLFTSVTGDVARAVKSKTDISIKLDNAQLHMVENGLPIQINIPATDQSATPSEVVKIVLSLIGGIITGIILKLLHHWWPQIFPDSTKEN